MIGKLQQLANISGKGALTILECMHYDGNGTFTASELGNTLSFSGLNIGVDTPFCVNAKNFVSILKSLPKGETKIELKDSALKITAGKAKYTLPTLPAEDFPFPNLKEETNKTTVQSLELKSLIQSTLFATSKDDLRISLTGINFSDGHAVATDAHKLVSCETDMALNFIMPASTARLFLTAFPDAQVDIIEHGNSVVIKSDNVTLSSVKIDERYPDWKAVIPQIAPNKLKVQTSHLVEIISRLILVSNPQSHAISFSLGSECIAQSADIDFQTSGTESIECEYDGDEMKIGFNGNFFLECLKSIEDEFIEIGFTAPNRACLINCEGKIVLVMPVSLIN